MDYLMDSSNGFSSSSSVSSILDYCPEMLGFDFRHNDKIFQMNEYSRLKFIIKIYYKSSIPRDDRTFSRWLQSNEEDEYAIR